MFVLAGFEGVRGEIRCWALEAHLIVRQEPVQITSLAADRTIAIQNLLNLAIRFEGDLSAMTRAFVSHCLTPPDGFSDHRRGSPPAQVRGPIARGSMPRLGNELKLRLNSKRRIGHRVLERRRPPPV